MADDIAQLNATIDALTEQRIKCDDADIHPCIGLRDRGVYSSCTGDAGCTH
jgi:hypothetical protein